MLSKKIVRATLAVTLVVCAFGCSTPWSRDDRHEVNLSFTLQNNLIYLPGVAINARHGRYFFGSAHVRTVLDPSLVAALPSRTYRVNLSEKEARDIDPISLDLAGVGEAILGADLWPRDAVTVDYRSGLVTYQRRWIQPAYMTMFHFDGEPSIVATVDGREIPVVVDSALPDTLVLPGSGGRTTASVTVAGTDFGTVDVARAAVPRARIGNRLLSRFLITIDYRGRRVGLWRDPRIPLRERTD